MKHSVEKRMLGIFAVMLVLIIGASMVLSYRSALALELQHDRGFAQSAALTWNSLFNDTPLKDLRDPAKKTLYEETRRELRYICSSLNLSYMYLYTVDKNEVRHYVMTCAANENDDAIVAELLGLGASVFRLPVTRDTDYDSFWYSAEAVMNKIDSFVTIVFVVFFLVMAVISLFGVAVNTPDIPDLSNIGQAQAKPQAAQPVPPAAPVQNPAPQAAQAQPAAGKTCPKCGAPVSDGTAFCTKCGNKIG